MIGYEDNLQPYGTRPAITIKAMGELTDECLTELQELAENRVNSKSKTLANWIMYWSMMEQERRRREWSTGAPMELVVPQMPTDYEPMECRKMLVALFDLTEEVREWELGWYIDHLFDVLLEMNRNN